MNFSSMMDSSQKYLKSAPVRVRMAGFESTTTRLQAEGWQISMEAFRLIDMDGLDVQVAFKHDGIKQMAIGRMRADLMAFYGQPDYFARFWESVGIDIQYIAPNIQFHVMPTAQIQHWTAIDARPSFASTSEIKNLADIAMFKPIKSEDFEIYIHEKDEAEILDLLLKKQDPKQKEIRQNMKRRAYMDVNGGNQKDNLADDINHDIRHQLVLVS